MRIILGVALYILFFIMCYMGTGTDKKNIKSFYTYPNEIQEKVKENDLLVSMIPKKPSYISSFFSNLILFTIAFGIIGVILSFNSFSERFLYFLLLGQGLNLFDLLVVDLLWWRNTKRTKFRELDVENELYKNPRKHIMAFLRGIPMFLSAAFISSLLLN